MTQEPTVRVPRRRVPFEVTYQAWEDFEKGWTWEQGEHLTMLGPTGLGKSTLALEILPRREYVCVFGTKRRDETLERFRKAGYFVARDWPAPPDVKRVILWPKIERRADLKNQREIFDRALAEIYAAGGWALYLDEILYVTKYLRLAAETELLWGQGRAMGVTVVGGTQRPAWIPLVAYDQATWLCLWRNNDQRNLKRLGELGHDSFAISEVVSRLPGHHFLLLNTRTGEGVITAATPTR